ncbi:MAG: tetratricopeptide repeat protein, partial [Planctomycetaceae bacterium]|nr:tetratricopeptide repeat protein [Planctomycetaceae bacterium]
LQVNPDRSNNDAVRLLTARAWSNQGEQNKALEIANSVWQTSANLDAAYWLAEFAYRAKDYPTAEENFLRVIAADPSLPVLPDALYGLAWTQSQTGETATAVQTFDRLLKEHPDHALANDALIGRGRVRRMNGDNQGAVEDFDRYLATQPNSTNRFNATYERALCLVQLKKWESAITAL